jgi:hypothetical protein
MVEDDGFSGGVHCYRFAFVPSRGGAGASDTRLSNPLALDSYHEIGTHAQFISNQ